MTLRPWGPAFAALVTMMTVLSGCSSAGASSQSAGSRQALAGTSWIAEDIGRHGVLDNPPTTMSFDQMGRVGGSGGCNRYGGPVEVSGEAIRFGPLASTRMACAPAIGDQEERFFAALQSASASLSLRRANSSSTRRAATPSSPSAVRSRDRRAARGAGAGG